MKKTTGWLVLAATVLLAAFAFNACENKVDEQTKGEVVLTVKNLMSQAPSTSPQLKGGLYTGLKGDSYTGIPDCKDGDPAYVLYWLTVDSASHKLNILQNYGNGELTVMEKLDAGTYTIYKFEVYDDNDELLWASPLEGSYYDNLFGLQDNVDITFTVEPFTKALVDVDVLCWQDYAYTAFGYNGFDLNYIKVKTVCFFGDVCTKFFDEWHKDNSPYAGQTDVFYDFPAIFSVNILDASGAVINDVTINSNADWFGTGAPLCVEYADHLGIAEDYTAVINLMLPDGTSVPLDSIHFTDDDATVAALAGADGIIDFVVGGGDCLDADADFHYSLPWMPLPSELTFTLRNDRPNGYFTLANIQPDVQVGEFVTGADLPAWCGNDTLWIHWTHTYKAHVYPYYGVPTGSIYSSITAEQWAKLNWIVNNELPTTDWNAVQKAIWYILNQADGANNSIAQAASSQGNYIPPVGGYVVVLVDPYQDTSGNPADEAAGIQLAIVRFDP